MEEELTKKLKKNKDKIIRKLKERSKELEPYFYIKKTYDNDCQISNNRNFQDAYRKFYIMNSAGLTHKHFEKYFQLLEGKETNLEEILNQLYQIKTLRNVHSIQFSFGTKLLHTINNDLPIYDIHIASMTNLLQPNDSALEKSLRIAKRLELYNQLIDFYKNILEEREIKQLLENVRTEFKWAEDKISNLKVLDYLLWICNQL